MRWVSNRHLMIHGTGNCRLLATKSLYAKQAPTPAQTPGTEPQGFIFTQNRMIIRFWC